MPIPKIVRTSTINEVVKDAMPDEGMYFSTKFPSQVNSPTNEIKYLMLHGTNGMAPITDRGVAAPQYRGGGASWVTQKGCLINEKIVYTEEDLNLCLNPDPVARQAAEVACLETVDDLTRRVMLRREWLAASIPCNKGVIAYKDQSGMTFNVNYRIPSTHKETLTGNYVWGTGSSRDPMGDVNTKMDVVRKSCGSPVTAVICNSTTFNTYIAGDTTLRDMMKNSAFRGAYNPITQPWEAYKDLFKVPFVRFDQAHQVIAHMTSTIVSDKFTVDNAIDLRAGATLQFCRGDEDNFEVVEEETISSISGNEITLSDSPSETFVPGRDFVKATIEFLPDKRLVFMAETVGGKPLLQWNNAPMGIGATRYGMLPKTWEGNDPDAVKTRIQWLGIWALRSNQAIATLDVA